METGELAQWLREFVALAGEPGSISSTLMKAHTHWIPVPGDDTHRYTWKPPMHIKWN